MEPARGPPVSVVVTGKAQAAGPHLTKLVTVAAANKATKHVGAEGSEYVADTLRNVKPPMAALQEVQTNCGLSNPMCMPLLTMLDYLGVKRREAHLHLLNRSKDMLLKHIADMKSRADSMAAERVGRGPDAPESPEELKIQEKFERLLIASFKYMGVAELKQVPIDVMASMTRVPAAYLKQLAEEREIFNELPPAVKQQVYEYDRNLLQQDAVQYIAAYKYETTTITTAISMRHYVRPRQPLLRKPPRSAAAAAAAGSGGAGRLPPKLGLGGGGSSAGGPGSAGRRGFNVANVLNSLGAPQQPQQPAQQPQHQRRTPPRSPAAGEPKPLGMIGQGGGSVGSSKHPQNTGASRSSLRKQSHVVRALVEIVGTSGKIYQHLIDLCKVRLAETESAYLGIKETSYCQLRTQVLMYLHDTEKTAVSSNKMGGGSGLPRMHKEVATSKSPEQLCDEEPIYKLAWNLDAAITQRKLTVKHMRQLAEALKQHLEPPHRWIDEDADISSAAAGAAAGARKPTGNKLPKGGRQQAAAAKSLGVSGALGAGVGNKRQRGQGSNPAGGRGKRSSWTGFSEEVHEEEDEGQWEEDGWIIKDETQKPKRLKQQQQQQRPQQQANDEGDELDAADVRGNQGQQKKWLGDAAMILRDPPALHLLAAEFVELLYRCIALRVLPADEPQLAWLLQLMELAVNARSCLRERSFSMPPVAAIKVKHVAEVQTRGGAQVAVELSPEEVVAAWSRGKGASRSEQQQQQQERGGRSEDDGSGGLLPPGQGEGKGYDWHTRKRGGKEYEVWFTDHDQLTEVWPEVMAVLAEGEMLAQPWQQDPADADVAPLSPGWKVVVGAYAGYELVRQVIQMLVLDRIMGNDLVTAYRLLRVIVASAHLTTPGADREYAPFGFAMAGMLEELVREGRLSATSKFWKLAFEGVLLRVVDAEQSRNQARVHKAMLDLLKTAAKQLSNKVLAGYLGTMLETTQGTRTRLQDRQEEFNRMQVQHAGGGLDSIPGYVNFSSTHHDWSDGFRLVRKEKYGSSDGLSSDYKALLAVGGLHGNEHLWPQILKDYMQAAAGRQQAEDATRRAEREEQQQAALAAAASSDGEDEDAPYDPTADF